MYVFIKLLCTKARIKRVYELDICLGTKDVKLSSLIGKSLQVKLFGVFWITIKKYTITK